MRAGRGACRGLDVMEWEAGVYCPRGEPWPGAEGSMLPLSFAAKSPEVTVASSRATLNRWGALEVVPTVWGV